MIVRLGASIGKIQAWRGLVGLALALPLAACFGSGGSYTRPEDIKPVYDIRNSPVPVPYPKFKPAQVPSRYAPPYEAADAGVAPMPVTSTPLPSSGIEKVGPGDTLYAISRRTGVPVRDLISANRLAPPYRLAVGQEIRVPNVQVHVVAKGDTGYSISRAYGVNLADLMALNNVRPPYTLAIGQRLSLPGGAEAEAVTPAVPSTVPSPDGGGTYAERRRETEVVGRVTAAPPPRRSSTFTWPLTGTIVARYGPTGSGQHNDGINILAPAGTPVKAAEDGVVVYASNALVGYGNLLLVKHAGGWITAYAHNERLLVRQGQKVTRGQVVARVGNTGGVREPQLHFEIRQGRQALDPLRFLERQRADAGPTDIAVW